MRFLVILITAALGGVLGLAVGDYLTRLERVSSFEGGRGYLVLFVFVPAGVVAGAVIGIWFARGVAGAPFAVGVKALGMSIVVSLIVAAIATGIGYFRADHPPTIDGEELALEYEFRIPNSVKADTLDGNKYTVLLIRPKRKDQRTEIFFARAVLERAAVVLPGRAFVASSSSDRLLSIWVEGRDWHTFEVALPSHPSKDHEQWSTWARQLQQRTITVPTPDLGIELRYRVRKWAATEPSS